MRRGSALQLHALLKVGWYRRIVAQIRRPLQPYGECTAVVDTKHNDRIAQLRILITRRKRAHPTAHRFLTLQLTVLSSRSPASDLPYDTESQFALCTRNPALLRTLTGVRVAEPKSRSAPRRAPHSLLTDVTCNQRNAAARRWPEASSPRGTWPASFCPTERLRPRCSVDGYTYYTILQYNVV